MTTTNETATNATPDPYKVASQASEMFEAEELRDIADRATVTDVDNGWVEPFNQQFPNENRASAYLALVCELAIITRNGSEADGESAEFANVNAAEVLNEVLIKLVGEQLGVPTRV